jgi:hypothetical protein
MWQTVKQLGIRIESRVSHATAKFQGVGWGGGQVDSARQQCMIRCAANEKDPPPPRPARTHTQQLSRALFNFHYLHSQLHHCNGKIARQLR